MSSESSQPLGKEADDASETTQPDGAASVAVSNRVAVDGRFFLLQGERFWVRGVTYGPFAMNEEDEPYPSREAAMGDLQRIKALGANVVRVYEVPPRWFLDMALENDIRLLIDVPWSKHLCFLDSVAARSAAVHTVEEAVRGCRGHEGVFAFSVVNEIPADIVRWSGLRAVTRFIDELISAGRKQDSQVLFTFASYPPTEYLHPNQVDFYCFNLFLHEQQPYEDYLTHLLMITGSRPVILGEYGLDSIREGEEAQASVLGWQTEALPRLGGAGGCVFSFTDDWHRGGEAVEDWAFGLTRFDRSPKPAFDTVRKAFVEGVNSAYRVWPRVSVVVAAYNAARTVRRCLESLRKMRYPDYEVILVDDGSTDTTAEISRSVPGVRYVHQSHQGLSVARNAGIAQATGEIVAFTDADCRVDEDWLRYIVADLERGGFSGVGGHNLIPGDDSAMAAAVMVAPGGPTHVMLTDREAEHVPGCNMAFRRSVLEEIGGFDPVFHAAGDDVDLCWRLQQRGYRIGFSQSGFVWHHRRGSIGGYLKQQSGYGEAEAVLAAKHPDYFNAVGGSLWRGRIYGPVLSGVRLRRAAIYHGLFGSGLFQRIYTPAPDTLVTLCTSLEYHALATLPLAVLTLAFPFFAPLFVVFFGLSFAACILACVQAVLPHSKQRFWSRPVVALLFFLQPLVRGWARHRCRLTVRSMRPTTIRRSLATSRRSGSWREHILAFWAEGGRDRYRLISAILARLKREGWQWRQDAGWGEHDFEVYGRRFSRVRLVTAEESLGKGKRVVRCRVEALSSVRALLVIAALVALSVLALSQFALLGVWSLIFLVVLLLFVALVEREKSLLCHLIAALVDEAAREIGSVRIEGLE